LLTDAGSQVLNPFLAKQGYGLTEQIYANRKAHLSDQLTLTPLNVHMTGANIDKPTYGEAVQAVYGRVADAFYSSGSLDAVVAVPSDLQQLLPFLSNFQSNFGLFGSSNAPASADQPSGLQLPDFLQPLFTATGLTPATFTATGHQNLLNLLPWLWLATIVLGALAVLFNRSGAKLSGLAKTVVNSAWPIVLALVGLWVASLTVYKATLAPYGGALGVIDRAFLPAYGGALALGAVGLLVPKLLGGRRQAQAPAPAMAGVAAGASAGSALSSAASTAASAASAASMASAAWSAMSSPPTLPTLPTPLTEPQSAESSSPVSDPLGHLMEGVEGAVERSHEQPQEPSQRPDAP
jgi:hypothetical protein